MLCEDKVCLSAVSNSQEELVYGEILWNSSSIECEEPHYDFFDSWSSLVQYDLRVCEGCQRSIGIDLPLFSCLFQQEKGSLCPIAWAQQEIKCREVHCGRIQSM